MKNIKALIVEDDLNSAYILKKILLTAGHEVVAVAETGEDALNRARELKPDIVLMDINIKGTMDGVEAADVIAREQDLPIIYLTGYSDDYTIERAKRTAPFAYILKPLREKEVLITIQMAIYKAQMDRKLKESEHRLAVTLGSLHDAVVATTNQGLITYLNPQAERLLSLERKLAEGKALSQVVHISYRDTNEKIPDIYSFLFRESFEKARSRPLQLNQPGQPARILSLKSTPLRDPEGQNTGYVVVFNEITDHYEAEENNRILATALASLEDAVIITDADLSEGNPRIIYANAAFEKITGYPQVEAVGRTLDLISGPRTDNAFRGLLKHSIGAGVPFENETCNYRKDKQEFTAQWTVSPVHAEDGQLRRLVFVLRDITRLRNLEDNIRQSQKIEAVGRLAGGIAHDFNNLLSVINSYSDLLSLKLDPDSPFNKYVKNIRTAGQRGADLVSQLMTFSRRESHSPTVVDLGETIQETQKLLHPLIRENIELEIRIEENLKPVKVDPGQIEQVLVNLCVNARDAMSGSGHITIEVRNVTHRLEAGVTPPPNPRAPGEYVTISVTDSGHGIDEKVLPHIFEPFFTTKAAGKGTGLGLAVVYGIVKQSGGYLDVQSKVGEGTTFRVYLPAYHAPDNKPVKAESATPALPTPEPHGDETVLIVEDDETFADCISGLLSLHGYQVLVSGEGQDALDRFGGKADEIKLLITDIVLPKISGREVASKFLEKNPKMKILFMSGYDDELDSFYSFPSDSVLLQKPFSLNTILGKVRELLDHPA